jgi:hypothetical protein
MRPMGTGDVYNTEAVGFSLYYLCNAYANILQTQPLPPMRGSSAEKVVTNRRCTMQAIGGMSRKKFLVS